MDSYLIDFVRLSKFSNGISYIIFSRFLWLRPLKTNSVPNVSKAFEDVFSEGRQPKHLHIDKGQEFRAKSVQKVFQKYKVHQFVTQNEVKTNYAERVIKTIKSNCYRYFTANQTYKYIDILPDLAESYNNTHYRSIGVNPTEVNIQNETFTLVEIVLAVLVAI